MAWGKAVHIIGNAGPRSPFHSPSFTYLTWKLQLPSPI